MTRTILHLTGAQQGGAERQLVALLETAAQRPDPRYIHEVVIVRPGPLQQRFTEVASTTVLAKAAGADVRFARDLRRTLAAKRPDIVHTWAPTPNLWGPIVARTLDGRMRPKVVMAEVGLDEWKGGVLKAADRIAYQCADLVVGCAQAVTAAAIRRGAPVLRTATVGLGVVVPDPPARRPQPGKVLLLGRMDHRKGHHRLLDAWPQVLRRVPGAELTLAGPAAGADELALRAAIDARIAADPVLAASVTRLDFVDPVDALSSAAVLVVPSSSEGLPNVILEAFSQRVPVVATDVGGIPELLLDPERGWCVPLADRARLVDALVAALEDPLAAQERADNGRRAVERMTLDASLDAWEAQYDRLLARRLPWRLPL